VELDSQPKQELNNTTAAKQKDTVTQEPGDVPPVELKPYNHSTKALIERFAPKVERLVNELDPIEDGIRPVDTIQSEVTFTETTTTDSTRPQAVANSEPLTAAQVLANPLNPNMLVTNLVRGTEIKDPYVVVVGVERSAGPAESLETLIARVMGGFVFEANSLIEQGYRAQGGMSLSLSDDQTTICVMQAMCKPG